MVESLLHLQASFLLTCTQQRMARVAEYLPLRWETWIEFLASSFSLARPQLLVDISVNQWKMPFLGLIMSAW